VSRGEEKKKKDLHNWPLKGHQGKRNARVQRGKIEPEKKRKKRVADCGREKLLGKMKRDSFNCGPK